MHNMTFRIQWRGHVNSEVIKRIPSHPPPIINSRWAERLRGTLITGASFIPPASPIRCIIVRREWEMDRSIYQVERVMPIYGGLKCFWRRLPSTARTETSTNKRGLPCLRLQNRQRRAPSLKDIETEKEENMDVSHWLLVPFLTFHANVYENSRRAPREDFSPASAHFLDTFFSEQKWKPAERAESGKKQMSRVSPACCGKKKKKYKWGNLA